MTPNDMVTFLKLRLANSNDSSLDANIITVANVVQERLEQEPELPWFLQADTNADGTNMTTTATEEIVALPTDFIREVEEYERMLFVQDSSEDDPWVPLARDDYSIIKNDVTGSGQPTHYDIIGTNLYLRKIPDDAYTLRLIYMKSDADIVAGTTENLWMKYASDWIMSETGWIIASTMVPMPQIAQQFQTESIRARQRVMGDTIARMQAGRMEQMGDD